MVIQMDEIEQKVKHLELIQGVIDRIGSNSLLIKGWCITIISAIFILAGQDMNLKFIIIAYAPVIAFWILDGYYLYQERLFRSLYDDVRIKNHTDFSMNTTPFIGGRNSRRQSIFSETLYVFYLSLIVIMLIIIYFSK
jgi:hypothetical protein